MADKQRIPLISAHAIATEIVEHLMPACERIEIAGSIRRRRPEVGDVEIVCIPKLQSTGLFGDGPPTDLVTVACDQLLASGHMAHRLDKNGRKSYGQKFKRLLFEGFPLDLFSVLDPSQFGVILTIRTGPAEFSKRLVTAKEWGGMMPRGFKVSDGYLWEAGAMVPCSEEADFFRAIGAQLIQPEKRV